MSNPTNPSTAPAIDVEWTDYSAPQYSSTQKGIQVHDTLKLFALQQRGTDGGPHMDARTQCQYIQSEGYRFQLIYPDLSKSVAEDFWLSENSDDYLARAREVARESEQQESKCH